MNALNLTLPEAYYISSFLVDWRMMWPMLKIIKVVTLMQAFEHAKWQDESNYTIVKKAKLVLLRTNFLLE
jgi:hypothetical protein